MEARSDHSVPVPASSSTALSSPAWHLPFKSGSNSADQAPVLDARLASPCLA